jgi:hypothetical protein
VNEQAPGAEANVGTSEGDGGAESLPWEVKSEPFRDSPEIFVGAAFIGGFVLARALRWLRG